METEGTPSRNAIACGGMDSSRANGGAFPSQPAKMLVMGGADVEVGEGLFRHRFLILAAPPGITLGKEFVKSGTRDRA